MSDKDQLDNLKNENDVEHVIDDVKNNDHESDKASFENELDDLENTGLDIYLDKKNLKKINLRLKNNLNTSQDLFLMN